ncbi:MAG TPA: hypothetical protein VK697_05055, partial [Methylomirabilota bacterium]|nr:hypothetical protein [Methylomirabilota bacterium]
MTSSPGRLHLAQPERSGGRSDRVGKSSPTWHYSCMPELLRSNQVRDKSRRRRPWPVLTGPLSLLGIGPVLVARLAEERRIRIWSVYLRHHEKYDALALALRVLRLAAVASILAFGLTARAITP